MDLSEYGGKIICQKDAFLAAAKGVAVGVEFQRKIGVGFFGGEVIKPCESVQRTDSSPPYKKPFPILLYYLENMSTYNKDISTNRPLYDHIYNNNHHYIYCYIYCYNPNEYYNKYWKKYWIYHYILWYD
jgi:hypothetical protein